MTADLRLLRDKPFELLMAIESRLQSPATTGVTAGAEDSWVGLAFRIGQHQLVAPRDDVREILATPEYTRVPGAKPWLLGIANVRGDLLPILDLNRLLGGEVTVAQRTSRVMVLSGQDMSAGFLVDEVAGFRRFQPQDQRHELVPNDGGPFSDYLLGAFVREGQTWLAFSLTKLAASAMFLNAAA